MRQHWGIGTPAPNSRLSVWGGVAEINTANLAGGEVLDWPLAAFTIRRFDDYTQMKMLQFAHIHDNSYQTGGSVWGISLLDNVGGKGLSDGNTNLMFQGPSNLLLMPAGNVGIGTTSPAYKLDVAGDIRTGASIYSAQRPNFFLAMQSDRNVVLYDNGAAIWKTNTYASDIRIKENIVPVAPVLESLEQIRVVEFNYKPGVADDKRHIGVIAQEVEAVYPDFVYSDPQSGRKLVQYDMLSTLAIQGVKELNAEHKSAIDELRAEIAALRAEIQLLKNRP